MAQEKSSSTDSNNKKIIIVGAGVFGLSTALHLAKRGYKDIHLYDRQPFHENSYAYSAGCDGASCDENKILRASYGNAKLYQSLAFAAMPVWREWNEMLSETPADQLPPGLTPNVKLWNNCGFLRLSENGLEQSEIDTQKNFPDEIKHTQFRISDERRRKDAQDEDIPFTKIDPFARLQRNLSTDGILDTTAGFVLASRACAFALHLCRKVGVQTYLGPDHELKSLIQQGNQAKGIITRNGHKHAGDLIIVACGGWTPSILPSVERLVETTAGSVLSIQLPQNRQDLWDKYSPEQFPVWSWNMSSYTSPDQQEIGGIYGLPRTPEGVIKMAFRGAKWTNYTRKSQASGRLISYPKTDVDSVPEEAIRVLRGFCEENMSELLDFDIDCRLCWYSDSVDNSFLIDYIPDFTNVVLANGGSGHGFKFLPVLGEHVVDVVEGKDTEYTRLFQWRDAPSGKRNGLEEGPDGWRTLDKQKMAGNKQWKSRSKL